MPKFIDGCELEVYEFYVFDRWGLPIFQTDDRSKHWDGTYKGVDCQVDVYNWIIKYQVVGQSDIIQKIGHVTIVK